MMTEKDTFSGFLFEEDYLIRTLGQIAHDAYIALTELVANAWDAGASHVEIFIPNEIGGNLIIRDDGTGLTKDQFNNRWMKLGYNRLKHQGDRVEFPSGRSGNRLAYGRNGVGRHGLLCFNDEYSISTGASGILSTYLISTHNENEPFVIKSQTFQPTKINGTTLEVRVTRNLPSLQKVRDVISARFLHDPEFKVFVNGIALPLEELAGHIDTRNVTIEGIECHFHFIDTTKANRSTIYQGIAFWQAGRLVGEPSWNLGGLSVIDGRTRYAKQYTVVIDTKGLGSYIKEDWSGFIQSEVISSLYLSVSNYVLEMFGLIAKQNIEETKRQVHQDFQSQISDLSALGKYEVDEAIESITINHPTTRPEIISVAVEAVINIEKTRNGKNLLQKLAKLTDDDITGLDRLLSEWTIKDALFVLDEIDKRISVIEAIRKLSSDKDVDELRVLHPLITEARWLFGPEYDSPEFSSNKQLATVIKQIFGKQIEPCPFINPKKRPDLVITKKSTISCTGTETINPESQMFEIQKILIIELKRGGYKIGRDERNQAQGYVEDFLSCGTLIGAPFINAYVVGERIDEKVLNTDIKGTGDNIRGKLFLTNFSQLVDTAERRLFNLRTRLGERYDEIPEREIYLKASIQPELIGIQAE
jgi:hypothetical protein